MTVDIDERMRKKEEAEKKIEQEKRKIRLEHRKNAEEKLQAIKEAGDQFNFKREKDEQKMKKKLEEKYSLYLFQALTKSFFTRKQKLEEERQERLRQVQEHEQRLQEKNYRAEKVREKHQKVKYMYNRYFY